MGVLCVTRCFENGYHERSSVALRQKVVERERENQLCGYSGASGGVMVSKLD